MQGGESSFIIGFAENMRDLRTLHAAACVERGGDQFLFGHGLRRIFRRRGRIKPIAKLPERIVRLAIPYAIGRKVPCHFIDPITDQIVGIGEHLHVPAFHVQRPRHFHRRIAPRRDGLWMRPYAQRHERHVERHGAPFDLVGTHVFQPAFQEPVYVIQISRGRHEQADVSRPTHAFVALRAVGWNGREVGTHRPYGVLVQTVEQRIRCGQFAGAFHHGMVDAAIHVGCGQFSCETFDLCIAEAVHRESWLPPSVGTVGSVHIALLASAQGSRGDGSVRFQHFHMT